ncbi:hypothetical protein BVY03_02940 [bacterium K02(2017)]|nr:hypothetical protein BVY03_02940 [bacterium K02(2017)]
MNQSKALVTGASRGIGKAIALELAKQKIDVIVHYGKNSQAANEVANQIKDLGQQAWVYQADLVDIEQTQKFYSKVKDEHDYLDYYILNAASTAFKPLLDLSLENIDKTFNLVIKSFLIGLKCLHPLLKGRDSQVLTISGIDTVKFCPGHGLLAAAKSSLETLSKYLSVELAADKIHIKCVNPGLVATDSTRFYLGEAFDQIFESSQKCAPHGGFVEPSQLAKIILLLLKPEANWLATKTIHMDGGLGFMLPQFLK